MILPILEEGVIELWRRYLQLLILALVFQKAIQLGQTTQRQSMRDGSLRVLGQSLSLVYIVVTVTRDKEAREEGTQDKRHKHTCY